MEVTKIADGLWRWTVPHPEWRPEKGGAGGWERIVGCLYLEPPGEDGIVLIDPLAPPAGSADAVKFWAALDRDVERRAGDLWVLLGNWYHQRSAAEVRERYQGRRRVEILAHREAIPLLHGVAARPLHPREPLPGGIQALEVTGLAEGEVAFFIPAHRALAVADCLIGSGSGAVRAAPPSWAASGEGGAASYRRSFRASLERLAALPAERILVCHGPVVLADGSRALAEALRAPAWGEAG